MYWNEMSWNIFLIMTSSRFGFYPLTMTSLMTFNRKKCNFHGLFKDYYLLENLVYLVICAGYVTFQLVLVMILSNVSFSGSFLTFPLDRTTPGRYWCLFGLLIFTVSSYNSQSLTYFLLVTLKSIKQFF